MGNAGSNVPRERGKSGSTDLYPGSPGVQDAAFVLEKKFGSASVDEEFSKSVPSGSGEISGAEGPRPRANTMTESASSSSVGAMSFQEEYCSKKTALPTVFKWEGGGKQVYITGTFSNWKPLPMVKSHGDFVTIIDLPEGDHQYKFLVDGEWKHDMRLKNVESDGGSKNNLVSVRRSDFEVFQALAKDSEDVSTHETKEWGQDIPQFKPWEKVTGPPVLPPHLLQVILNKDTPVSCEPTLLPEPNHVMLNHLYALSIKDGVMVLSATHRYRKKYVTTLLYKPI